MTSYESNSEKIATAVSYLELSKIWDHRKTYKSSAVAQMGDRGHNRHGPKRGAGAVPLSRGSWVLV